MKTASKLFRIYLDQRRMPNGAPDRLTAFLKEKLSEEDYLSAEEILTEALAKTEEEAFYQGFACLPNLMKELLEE